MDEILKVEHLEKRFALSRKQRMLEKTDVKTKVAVNNLSFSANKGEIFGLLGPNGAGKTTTLRIIATLLKPDGGDAFIGGVSVKEHPEQIRGKIGFLTGELKLEDFFTPDYLFDFFSELYNVPRNVRESRKEEMFGMFGIGDFRRVKVANLSTGMKQKVSLVISVAHDPDFIIFDEPTNGLDVLTAKLVTDFLLELRARGKSIILSTHIFSLVEKLCDRAGIIFNGSLAACGTLDEICGGDTLENAFFKLYAERNGKL